jgi:ribosome-binding factor A
MGPGLRGRRVAETVREHLSDTLRKHLGDPRLTGLVITDVQVPDDLGTAHVLVRLIDDDGRPARRRELLAALASVRGRLRRSLGPKLRLRRVPELSFRYDAGQDHATRVDELLREIASETPASEPGAEPPQDDT